VPDQRFPLWHSGQLVQAVLEPQHPQLHTIQHLKVRTAKEQKHEFVAGS
jgi:hypothetical protein